MAGCDVLGAFDRCATEKAASSKFMGKRVGRWQVCGNFVGKRVGRWQV